MKEQHSELVACARALLNTPALGDGLPIISKYAKKVIDADRCSVFIYNETKNILWTTIADGIDPIIISADQGIVGHTLKEKKPIIVLDAKRDPLYLDTIEKKSGYEVINIITAPIFNSEKKVIGILELLNKPGGFDDDDVTFMIFFAHYVSGYMELASLFESDLE